MIGACTWRGIHLRQRRVRGDTLNRGPRRRLILYTTVPRARRGRSKGAEFARSGRGVMARFSLAVHFGASAPPNSHFARCDA